MTRGLNRAGQEAKDESMNHSRISLDGRTAVFEAPGAEGRVTFRSPGSGTLNITVARQRNGVAVTAEFKYARMTP